MEHAGHNRRDFWAGGLMVAVGIGAVLEAWTYDVGSLSDMGPGFLPVVLGAVLILIGVLIAAGLSIAGDSADAEPGHVAAASFDWRGGGAIILGVVAFIALGAYVGLVPAIFGCVLIAALGDRTSTWAGAAVLALSVTVLGTLLFSYLLKVPFPLFRW